MKRFLILMLLLVPFGALGTMMRTTVVEPDRDADLRRIPLQAGHWLGQDVPIGEATAASLQATSTLLRNYAHSDGAYLSLFVAYFRDQKYGSQIHSPRHCLPGGGWIVSDLQQISFDLGAEQITCNRMTITRRSAVDQMFYWYRTRSGTMASEYSLKFDLVKNSLLFSPTDAALIRLTVSQGARSVAECQRLAETFFQSFYEELQVALPFKDHADGTEVDNNAATPTSVG
jgi:EpsI family protein